MIGNKPSKKKIPFPISKRLGKYLEDFNKSVPLPVLYEDMTDYMGSLPLYDDEGVDTHWETIIYNERQLEELNISLCQIYALLKTDGDTSVIEHLKVDRVDFCKFGNTRPFRIRIINMLNDNYDHYYIKKIDASRVYGLELEELLSPNTVSYLVDKSTLIEEHIAGIPGDDFIKRNLDVSKFDQLRIAKEFIKFNERCFVRLLGDMRAYNFIVDITPDIGGAQYRLRAIDFDQQSYEGRKNFYLPQYFKENNPIIELGMKHLSKETVVQYQLEERSLIARRSKVNRSRINQLMASLLKDEISSKGKIDMLAEELSFHHQNDAFQKCTTMGEIIYKNLELVLQKEFKRSELDY